MTLAAGSYYIVSSSNDQYIGRNFIEDLSLLPKRVMTLPSGRGSPPKWEVMDIGNGKNKIKTNSSYVGVLPDGHLYAFLLEDMIQGAEWKFVKVPQHGDDAYIITRADDDERGWVAKNESHEQISVAPLISTKTLPPRYMPASVFKIVPVN